MGVYKDDNGEMTTYWPLIEQLDATFLSNDRSNFDPGIVLDNLSGFISSTMFEALS